MPESYQQHRGVIIHLSSQQDFEGKWTSKARFSRQGWNGGVCFTTNGRYESQSEAEKAAFHRLETLIDRALQRKTYSS